MNRQFAKTWLTGLCFCFWVLACPAAMAIAELEVPTAPPTPAVGFVHPLSEITAVLIQNGTLQVEAATAAHLSIKARFVLNNPRRLVIDLANAKLGVDGTPIVRSRFEGVSVQSVRVSQFTADTVRIVLETEDPERLQVSVGSNRLIVSAEKQRSLLSGLYRRLFGISQPVVAAQPPLPSAHPPIIGPRPGEPFSAQRVRIIEIAREQLGLSKDSNPDYVNQVFSRGKDEAWCADFVSTVLDWAGGSPWGHLSRVQDIYEWALANQRVTNRPEPANLVIFSYGANSFNHVAFIESVDGNGMITTIGGNEGYAAAGYKTQGSVSRSTYRMDDKRILGFVDPLFQPLSVR
jgi:hypothetical protein